MPKRPQRKAKAPPAALPEAEDFVGEPGCSPWAKLEAGVGAQRRFFYQTNEIPPAQALRLEDALRAGGLRDIVHVEPDSAEEDDFLAELGALLAEKAEAEEAAAAELQRQQDEAAAAAATAAEQQRQQEQAEAAAQKEQQQEEEQPQQEQPPSQQQEQLEPQPEPEPEQEPPQASPPLPARARQHTVALSDSGSDDFGDFGAGDSYAPPPDQPVSAPTRHGERLAARDPAVSELKEKLSANSGTDLFTPAADEQDEPAFTPAVDEQDEPAQDMLSAAQMAGETGDWAVALELCRQGLSMCEPSAPSELLENLADLLEEAEASAAAAELLHQGRAAAAGGDWGAAKAALEGALTAGAPFMDLEAPPLSEAMAELRQAEASERAAEAEVAAEGERQRAAREAAEAADAEAKLLAAAKVGCCSPLLLLAAAHP